MAGFSAGMPLAGAGVCVDGVTSGAAGAGLLELVVPATTIVSSGLVSETSAEGGWVLSGTMAIGTIGATLTGSEGRTASRASGLTGSGAGTGSGAF